MRWCLAPSWTRRPPPPCSTICATCARTKAAGLLETLEADPGNAAPEILDALRRAVDPRSSFSSDDKVTYDNYIRAGIFTEAQFRKYSRLNPDRSDREIMNFLALLNQGVPLPGYVTREPEPVRAPGEKQLRPGGPTDPGRAQCASAAT